MFGDFSRAIHAFGIEVAMCFEDQVQCKKDFEHCIGGCAGDDTSNLMYDFATTIAIADLNPDVVGEDGFASAHANCTVKTGVVEVDLFEGGDSFNTFAVRMQIRSGMSALDNTWCEDNPLSCGVIQRALEKSPGLVFVPGSGWRHRYDMVPPAPPPPPNPPPRFLTYGPAPPYPSPPPLSPPPYYDGAEPCTPIPTAQFFGVDARRENAGATHSEYRSACAFTKRVVDKRIRAKSCFASVLPPSPPPPPPTTAVSAQQSLDSARERRIRGEARQYAGRPIDDGEEYTREIDATVQHANAMIAQLGEDNPILRSLLGNAVSQMRSSALAAEASAAATPTVVDATDASSDSYGRRLMQRQ